MNLFFKKTSLVCTLLLLELILLWYFKSGENLYLTESNGSYNEFLREYGGYQFLFVANIQRIFITALLSYLLMVILIIGKKMKCPYFFIPLNHCTVQSPTVLVNIASFCILSAFFVGVQNPKELVTHPHSLQSILFALSPVVWGLYLYSIFDAVFPIRYFLSFAAKSRSLMIAILLTVFAINNPGVMNVLISFWSNLLLVPTIEVASSISHIFGLNYHMLPDLIDGAPAFGTNEFKVGISPACSGYEGMSLIVFLLGVYFIIQQETLRICRALLLFPIAGLIMFLLNGFRIFVLVAIGHYWSPQVALDGFHSVAGWLNLLATFIFSVLALNYFQFFQKEAKHKIPSCFLDFALLTPLMSLIIISLLTKSISPNFAWLYPAHILFTAFVLYLFRKSFLLFIVRPSALSVLIGVAVFILWIILIPENQAESTHFFRKLNAVPLWLALLWLLFRVVGASVIVPIAEEFAFRGYIQPHLQNWFYRKGFKSASVITSLGATALLFGYVHSNILAGFFAGLLYGLAYLRRKQLIDAVMAHVLTNALLAFYVMSFGYWSYW